jgi:hypothetical protein
MRTCMEAVRCSGFNPLCKRNMSLSAGRSLASTYLRRMGRRSEGTTRGQIFPLVNENVERKEDYPRGCGPEM